jgi:DNA-binding transcriptional MerR regulator
VSSSAQFLNPSAAAQRLGVSAKALRLYEQRGLVTPRRTAAGWRAYGPDEMARTAEIVNLRALGLSLSQIARVLGDDPQGLEPALASHQAALEGRCPIPLKKAGNNSCIGMRDAAEWFAGSYAGLRWASGSA